MEGLDGAGTTTQAARLAVRLGQAGVPVVSTREPSDGPIGTMIRQAIGRRLVQPDGATLGDEVLALLFAADRCDHIRSTVRPALEQGRWVISDRYVHSSLAYQGASLDREWVAGINREAPPADLVIQIDVPVEVCLERMVRRARPLDIFERERFLEQVVRGYDEAYRLRPDTHVRVDGGRDVDEVALEVWRAVAPLLDHEPSGHP